MLDSLPSSDWTPAHAAHLLNRAGFGGSPAEIAALHALGPAAAVNSLIHGDEDADLFPPPDWVTDPRPVGTLVDERDGKPTTEPARVERNRKIRQIENARSQELIVAWMRRMQFTTNPLREKLTLFWHDHFATSNQKVQDAYLMWVQNETLRARALGPFRFLLQEISRDPAMLKWLDLIRSNVKKPNENFAREFFELFTLGEGNYTEADLKEAARAFTGYRFGGPTRTFQFARKQHDATEKTIFGQTGAFDGDDVVQLALANPHSAPFLAGKLWTYFATDRPNPTAVDSLAAELRRTDFDLAATLTTLFRSREFYAPDVRNSQIKSPVQWLVQTCRALEIPMPDGPVLSGALAQLGQLPFAPPNVAGWDWGRAWINSTTLVLRYNLAGFLLGSSGPAFNRLFKPDGVYRPEIGVLATDQLRSSPATLADDLVTRLFGPGEHAELRVRALATITTLSPTLTDDDIRTTLHQLMATPEFQLT